MGLSDIVDSFDGEEYRRHLLKELESPNGKELICQREIRKQRQINGSAMKIAASTTMFIVAGPAGMVGGALGGALGARQGSIADQKLKIIQQIMTEKGWDSHKETKRDVLIPLAATVVGLGFGDAMGGGVSHIASMGAQMTVAHGAHEAAHYTAIQTMGQAAAHPAGFMTGVEHGVKMGADQITSVFKSGDLATNSAVAAVSHGVPVDSSVATVMGMNAGHTAVVHGAHKTASWAASKVVKSKGDCVMKTPWGTQSLGEEKKDIEEREWWETSSFEREEVNREPGWWEEAWLLFEGMEDVENGYLHESRWGQDDVEEGYSHESSWGHIEDLAESDWPVYNPKDYE